MIFFNKKKKYFESVSALLPAFGLTVDKIGIENANNIFEMCRKANFNQYEAALFTAYAHTNGLYYVDPAEAEEFFEKLSSIQLDWSNSNLINKQLVADWGDSIKEKMGKVTTGSNSQENDEYPFSPDMPDMTVSNPDLMFKADNYIIAFSENIPSIAEKLAGEKLPLIFTYVMAVMNQRTSLPNYFVTLETGLTKSTFLCAFDKNGKRINYGPNEELKDKELFINKAISLIKDEFKFNNITKM